MPFKFTAIRQTDAAADFVLYVVKGQKNRIPLIYPPKGENWGFRQNRGVGNSYLLGTGCGSARFSNVAVSAKGRGDHRLSHWYAIFKRLYIVLLMAKVLFLNFNRQKKIVGT